MVPAGAVTPDAEAGNSRAQSESLAAFSDAARVSARALRRRLRWNLTRPLVYPLGEELREDYLRLRAVNFRQQVGTAVNVIITVLVLREIASYLLPLFGPLPLSLVLGAVFLELVLWLAAWRSSSLRTLQGIAVAIFLVPLLMMMHYGMAEVTPYIIVIFVMGVVLPWTGLESSFVSLLPFLGFMIVRRVHGGPDLTPTDLFGSGIAIVIVMTLQFRAERERRFSFEVETEAAEARRKITDSLAVAAQLHAEIISDDCDLPMLSARVLYEPMQQLGGDYVKIRALSPVRCATLIADVTGHGVPAALMINRINAKVEGLMDAGLGPREAMSELNGFVLDVFAGTSMLMSALWAEYDAASGRLQWVNYGHPAAFHVRRSDRSIQHLRSTTCLMGIHAAGSAAVQSLAAGAGDYVLFHTDGLVDLPTAEGPLTEKRLERHVRALVADADVAPSPDEVIGSIARLATSCRVCEVQDDLLAVVWRIRQSPRLSLPEA